MNDANFDLFLAVKITKTLARKRVSKYYLLVKNSSLSSLQQRKMSEEQLVEKNLRILHDNAQKMCDSLMEILKVSVSTLENPQSHFIIQGLAMYLSPLMSDLIQKVYDIHSVVSVPKDYIHSLGFDRISSMGEQGFGKFLIERGEALPCEKEKEKEEIVLRLDRLARLALSVAPEIELALDDLGPDLGPDPDLDPDLD